MNWLSTLNLGRGGVSKTSEALASFDVPPDLLALQEIGLNPESRVPYIRDWRRRGYSCILGPGDRLTNVGLVARCPISPFALPRQEANDRVVAGLCEFIYEGRVHKTVVGSVYAHARDEAAAFDLVQSVIGSLHEVGLPWILLGDFNLTLEHSGLQSLCARGTCVPLDFVFEAPSSLPATRVNGNRRIDFGLACGRFLPLELRHYLSVSDHFAVSYCFSFEPWRSMRLPSRVPLAECSEDEIAAKFVSCFDPLAFDGFLQVGDVDSAWTALSGAAERALTEAPPGTSVPRADLWDPAVAPEVARGARCDEPVLLRRLRRLHRRLLQLQRHPADACLRSTSLRSLSSLAAEVPELSTWRDGSLPELVAGVVAAISRCQAEFRAARLARWKDEVSTSQAKAIAWVKQRVAAETAGCPPARRDPAVPVCAVHPVSVIREAEKEWLPLWTQEAPPLEAFEAILREVGQAQPVSQAFVSWTGTALRHLAKAMCGRAPGHDAWAPEELLRLPDSWFDSLARLWQVVWESGRVPSSWKRARVALLQKSDGGWRPLSITPVVWRLGSQHVVRSLRAWCDAWASPHILGGLARRSVEQAHVRISEAMTSCDARLFVAQDLSKCFDCVSVDLAVRALRHWGAPPQLIALLRSFYCGQERLFSHSGHVGCKWHAVSHGILQGCPLSPLVAAALLQVWALLVCKDGTDGVVYIDDRTLWTEGIGAEADRAMRAALQRSARFDSACRWRCRPGKCQIAASDLQLYEDFVRAVGYPAGSVLTVLGLRHSTHGGCVPDRVTVEELRLRCRFLRVLGLAYGARASILRSLVTAKFTWIAAVATEVPFDFAALRTEICLALVGQIALKNCPRALVFEIFGWGCDPRFAFEWAALQAAVRWQLRLPVWHEHVCLRFAVKQWPVLLPGAATVLQHWSWWASADGANIHRRDGGGHLRSFRIGVDSLSLLRCWLEHEFKRTALAEVCRVATSLHRPEDPALAQGIVLPKPAGHLALCARAHRQVFFAQGVSRQARQVCLGSGCSVWFQNAVQRRPKSQWHIRCFCGREFPSRPHLMFQCPELESIRRDHGVGDPVDRAEERLLAVAVPEMPPPPPARPFPVARDGLVQLLQVALSGSPTLLLCASDGSAKDSVAGWAVAVESAGVSSSLLETEDHLPFLAEVFALVALHEALAILAVCASLPAVQVICDCQAALRVCEPSYQGPFSVLSSRICAAAAALRRSGTVLTCSWVPAHGRVSSAWRPPDGISEARARQLNAVADAEAKRCVLLAWQGSDRRDWYRRLGDARDRETRFLRAANAVASRYSQWVAEAA